MIKWLLGTAPAIGSVWRFSDEVNDPFIKPACVVVATKNGYVQYRWYSDTDNRYLHSASIRAFRSIYRQVNS